MTGRVRRALIHWRLMAAGVVPGGSFVGTTELLPAIVVSTSNLSRFLRIGPNGTEKPPFGVSETRRLIDLRIRPRSGGSKQRFSSLRP